MKITRGKTKIIKIGNICIGGENPIAIQSMTKTKTKDIERTIRQIKKLESVGCEIVRLAVKDNADAQALSKIKPKVKISLVADIHFDWRLGIKAIDSGVDKIRLNPGNIYKREQIREIARAAKTGGIPIRVGINSGSIRKCQASSVKCHSVADKMVKSALDYIKILEKSGFYDIVVSLKASNIFDTIEAYRKFSRLCGYPLHLGVTATGLSELGIIKSSIALGNLLLEGIGDTIRISLTDEPQEEVKAAKSILAALGLRRFSPEIISCPTCGRCEVDLVKIVKDLEERLNTVNCKLLTVNSQPLKVAIMGCLVNGPGEAREADIGIAFGKKEGLLFKQGKPARKIPFNKCADVLLREIGR